MTVLVLNTGSSSVKYQLFRGADPTTMRSVADGLVEGIGEAVGSMTVRLEFRSDDQTSEHVTHSFADHNAALSAVFSHLSSRGQLKDLTAIGHRVVHGGERFTSATLLDPEVIAQLEEVSALAPLHNPPAIKGIRQAMTLRPDLPHVAVFDTAFHAALPPEAYRYAVPQDWYAEHGVRRYGFHGTSHQYVAAAAAAELGQPLEQLRLITLHLGNGASACAVLGGQSIDTSMGLTPLEGLVMGTRSGDIDPAVVFHMMREGMTADQVEGALNHDSGLQGLAGDNDLRRVAQAADHGDDRAWLALEVMARRIRGYVGAYLAELGGLDALVFTGGIGENSALVRQKVVDPLGHLGLLLDEEANVGVDTSSGQPVRISPADASPQVLVVATDEEWMIATETLAVIAGIPIPE